METIRPTEGPSPLRNESTVGSSNSLLDRLITPNPKHQFFYRASSRDCLPLPKIASFYLDLPIGRPRSDRGRPYRKSLRSMSPLPNAQLSTTLTTCHQKPAAIADKMASSGRKLETPRLIPVQPTAAQRAIMAHGLRMAVDRPPCQLQFQSRPESRQSAQPPAEHAPRGLPAMGATFMGRLPVRPVGIFPAVMAMQQGFHGSSFFLAG